MKLLINHSYALYLYDGYKIGSTKEGILNGIKVTLYADCGCSPNDNYLSVAADHIDNGIHNCKPAVVYCMCTDTALLTVYNFQIRI